MFHLPGKILNDDTALKEYKIDEKNFVVVMVTKVSNPYFWKENSFHFFFHCFYVPKAVETCSLKVLFYINVTV